LLEAPFPANSSDIAGRNSIPPQAVTHVLVIVDAAAIAADPEGKRIDYIMRENGATGVAIGNVWSFDPESAGATSYDGLGEKTQGLISFVEQFLRRPVVFLATSPTTVVDREEFPMHEEPDPTRVFKYGG
jgi:hypothetical protein